MSILSLHALTSKQVLYLAALSEAQSVAVFKLNILHHILLLLCLFVGVELQSRGHWEVVCDAEFIDRINMKPTAASYLHSHLTTGQSNEEGRVLTGEHSTLPGCAQPPACFAAR